MVSGYSAFSRVGCNLSLAFSKIGVFSFLQFKSQFLGAAIIFSIKVFFPLRYSSIVTYSFIKFIKP